MNGERDRDVAIDVQRGMTVVGVMDERWVKTVPQTDLLKRMSRDGTSAAMIDAAFFGACLKMGGGEAGVSAGNAKKLRLPGRAWHGVQGVPGVSGTKPTNFRGCSSISGRRPNHHPPLAGPPVALATAPNQHYPCHYLTDRRTLLRGF